MVIHDLVGTSLQAFNSIIYILSVNTIILILLPVILPTIVCLLLLRSIIDIYLRLKYGKNYGGPLRKGDAVWKGGDKRKGIINVVAIVNVESGDFESFAKTCYSNLQKEIFDHPDENIKFTSLCKSLLSFGYLHKNQIKINDCFRVIDKKELPFDHFDRDSLTEFVSSYGFKPLPLNHESLWELVMLPIPIHWNKDAEKGKQYPLIIRFNHIFGDGFSIYGTLLKIFAKDKITYIESFKKFINKVVTKGRESEIPSRFDKFKTILQKIALSFYIVWMMAPLTLHTLFFRKGDSNCLHGPKLTDKKHLVFAVEEHEVLVDKIRDIRRHLHGSTFTNILLTAFSASLSKYMEKVSESLPDSVTFALAAALEPPNIESNPENKFLMSLIDMPVKSGGETLLKRLSEVKKNIDLISNSPKIFIGQTLIDYVCPILPIPSYKYMLTRYTGSSSIVPCIPEKMIGDGFNAQDVIFFPPQIGRTGIAFCVLTYNGRLQVSLTVAQVLIPNVKDVQSFAQDILDQIDALHQEVIQKYNNNDTNITVN